MLIDQELDKAIKQPTLKDAALALMNDDLQGWDNQIQAIQYENVVLQDVYQAEL